MHFVIDAQLPPALADWLRDKGHLAETVASIGLRDADDGAICAFATEKGAIVVTKDEDFALLTASSGQPRILWVRCGNVVNRVLLVRFEQAWAEVESHFEAGASLVEFR